MPIPTIIHQIWIQGQEDLPEIYRRAAQTWQRKNPAWNYMLWDDRALREFMAAEAPEWLPLYELQEEMTAKSDVGRYALLLVRGGLYADMDTECVRPVATMLKPSQPSLFLQVYDYPWTFVRFRSVRYDRIATSVIASTPAHPIWGQVRSVIERNPSSWIATGPWMFWPLAKSYAEHHAQDVCFLDHRQIFTTFYLPRACMRWYSFIRRKICVLDFNDSARQEIPRLLRRPDRLIVGIARDLEESFSRKGKCSARR
jgi:mannosyltransferase OCH1-like enzyme